MDKAGAVAIIGGGIAGLTLALCLARKGIASDVLEQAAELSDVGAGLQLSPNATGILRKLGLLSALEARWSEPQAIDLVDGPSLRPIAGVPSGAFAANRWHAPYAVLHRASLQQVLLDAVRNEPLCRLHLGCRIEGKDPSIAIAATTGRPPSLIVGADGVWSNIRNGLQDTGKARFSGNVAFRMTLRQSEAVPLLDPRSVTAFLGPRAHVVAYPLKETGSINIVAITAGNDAGKQWAHPVDDGEKRRHLLACFSGWNGQILSLLERAQTPGFWPLYEVTDGNWHRGDDIVLIGDAAHAMMPFAAQGAAMAIEDAFELASFLSNPPDGQDPLSAFVAHRKPRIARVRARAAFNRFAYHARGPVRIARNLVLSLRSPGSLAADFDWLYGYESRD